MPYLNIYKSTMVNKIKHLKKIYKLFKGRI